MNARLRQLSLVIFILSLVIIPSQAEARLNEIGVNPFNVEVGARPMGLGGAYVAVDDVNAIFYNPAGLAWSKGLSLTLKDLDNLAGIQAYPLGNGSAIGLGVVSRKLADIAVSGGTATSASNLVYLSYGTKLSLLPNLTDNALCQRLGVGLTVKSLMSETLKVSGATDRSATGWTTDLGVLWKGGPWWSAGLSLQNLKTFGGGTINWDDGSREAAPELVRLGTSAQIIGDIDAPFFSEGQQVSVLGELDWPAGGAMQLRLGSEWLINKQFYLRAGLTPSDVTFGMGAHFDNWGVDFASWRETGRVTYVSLTYYPKDWVVIRNLDFNKPSVILEKPFEKLSLEDNVVTYDDRIEVVGQVKSGVEVNINNLKAFLDADNAFKVVVPLQIGKNLIVVEAMYQGEKKLWKYKVLRKAKVNIAGPPKEVQKQKEKVEELVTLGVIELTPEAEFKLQASVTRGELATWLAKATGLRLPKVEKDVFVDVKMDNPLAPYIKAVVEWELLQPYPDGTFRPDAPVSKEEGDRLFKLLEKQK